MIPFSMRAPSHPLYCVSVEVSMVMRDGKGVLEEGPSMF